MVGDATLIDYYDSIHKNKKYGYTSINFLRFIRPDVQLLKPNSILDYGCGQSQLLESLEMKHSFEKFRYDPAIEEYSSLPENTVDLLLNIDVLEHIEENDIDDLVTEMSRISKNSIIIIDTKPATLILPDGRNAHVTLKSPNWWYEKLSKHFDYLEFAYQQKKSRVSFRTWRRKSTDVVKYQFMKLNENVMRKAAKLIK